MLETIALNESNRWDDIVCSFNDYDTYWLSGYVRAFYLYGDGEPILFYYHDDSARGINVVMKRDIGKDPCFLGRLAENECYDFSTPYGYGGWLIEGNHVDKLFETYVQWCQDNDIVSEFVRFHPVIKNHLCCTGFYDVKAMGETVTIALTSPEQVWNGFTSQNRNKIRKAEKEGLSVCCGQSYEMYRAFREIYVETMDKNHADPYYYFPMSFFESIRQDLAAHAQVFGVMLEDRCVSASIMLAANGRMNYHLTGTRQECGKLAANNLLLYQAALWGCENGFKTLYLGGGVGSRDDSLLSFKKSFSRSDCYDRFYIGRRVFNDERYNSLVNMREGLQETGFFPAYRAKQQ